MSGSLLWDRLWQMHDEAKGLMLFKPQLLARSFAADKSPEHVYLSEKDVVLADELTDAPSEHRSRLKTGPGGVDEGDPRQYTLRQSAGLIIGPVLFLLMLFSPLPPGMSVPAQKMAAVALLMATWWMTEALPIPVTPDETRRTASKQSRGRWHRS